MSEVTADDTDKRMGMFDPHEVSDEGLNNAAEILREAPDVDSETVMTGTIHYYDEATHESVRWVHDHRHYTRGKGMDKVVADFRPEYIAVYDQHNVFYLWKSTNE